MFTTLVVSPSKGELARSWLDELAASVGMIYFARHGA
jgi:hypothetical protein